MKRQWLMGVVVIGFIVLVASHLTDIRELTVTLARGQWQWVLLAGGLQILYAVFYAALYQAAFATVEVDSRVGELLPVLFASVFVNLAAPMTGAAGVALFSDDATQRGQSGVRAAAGSLLVMVADFGTFALVLVAGMVVLWKRGMLQTYQWLAAGGLLLLTGGLVAMLVLGLRQRSGLHRLFLWMQTAVNRLGGWFGRPRLLAETWAERTAGEFSEATQAISAHPQHLLNAVCWGLAMHLTDLLTLYALFLAFRQPVSLGVLVAGYAMGLLFWIVAVTPSGIGVVEGVMTVVLTSLGVPVTTATVVVLAYRGLGFWLPVGIGFCLLRRVKSFGGVQRAPALTFGQRAATIFRAMLGAASMLSLVLPVFVQRLAVLTRLVPVDALTIVRSLSVLTGVALWVLAFEFKQRKQLAWQQSLFVLSSCGARSAG